MESGYITLGVLPVPEAGMESKPVIQNRGAQRRPNRPNAATPSYTRKRCKSSMG